MRNSFFKLSIYETNALPGVACGSLNLRLCILIFHHNEVILAKLYDL